VLRAYDDDLNATAHGARKAPVAGSAGGGGGGTCGGAVGEGGGKSGAGYAAMMQGKEARQEYVKELPLPAAVPIHVLRVTTPAVEAPAGADVHALTHSLQHAQCTDVAAGAEVGVSPPATTRHLAVPTLPLPDRETSYAAAASNSAPACDSTGKEGQGTMKCTGEEKRGAAAGSGQPSGWMHIAQSETPAPSTALPSARSSMECAGRYIMHIIMHARSRSSMASASV